MPTQVITLIVVGAIMFLVIGGLAFLSHYYTLDGIKSKTVGDGQHGTARWATKQEIRQTYAHVPFEPELWRKGEHLPEKQEATILLVSGGSKIRLRLRDLLYAETDGHYLIFHTAEGQIRQCGTISTLEADLTNKQFVRCNSCYLVNLQHIAGIKGYSLLLDNGEELKISQPRKKQVQQTYNEYLAAH